ncbi:MAG TPA: DMT family transporter [Candidatus Saccharimonadales bacterium]|nr:DMT family transporter [Candidatus Saccharimonadales bacterium]
MLYALIAAVTDAGGLLLDKIILARERVTLRVYLPILFAFVFILTAVLWPTLGRVDWELLRLTNTMFLFLIMIVTAIAWNVLFYQSVQRENVQQHELVVMTAPLVTVVLAAVFFPEDLNYKVLILAIIASLALIFAKGGRQHFALNRTSYNTLLGVVLMSVESIIAKELLYTFTPVALYASRTFFLALFFFFYYRPQLGRVEVKHYWMIFWSALIGVVSMLTKYYAFSDLGVVYTTMIGILAPVLVFFLSWEILHEKVRFRMILGSLIVLVCVALATVITVQ